MGTDEKINGLIRAVDGLTTCMANLMFTLRREKRSECMKSLIMAMKVIEKMKESMGVDFDISEE